jgi:ubiquinone biosynthesis UbiH/UbiF/VisC/COQ6 family hydroxylase
MRRRREIVINGAGTVGLTLAALLGASPAAEDLGIHLIESRGGESWRPERTDLRVYALSRASQGVLERLGVWSSVADARVSAYERMHVWEGDDPHGVASIDFDCAEIGEPNLGHIVEDSLLKDRLRERVAVLPNVNLLAGAELESIDRRASGVTIELRGGGRLRCDLLVGADGGDSTVRASAGLPVLSSSYGQRAIVAHVATERPHERTARQRFLAGGPLAFLPLADGRSSVVWSLPETRAAELMSAADADFIAALEEESGGALGRLGPISERACFPLQVLLALRYCENRIVLIGDAAHVVHPLAGQGMNLGLADAACLAAEMEAGLGAGRDPSDFMILRRYERRRKAENLKMLVALDALNRLFRLPAWFAPVRAFGLHAVDSAAPVKRLLMRQALGLG